MAGEGRGMIERMVRLEPYSEGWPTRFRRIKSKLERELSELEPTIEHIGSTAIMGLTAKPVIDVAVGFDSLDTARGAIPILERMGYKFMPEFAERTGEALLLVRGPQDFRSEHVFLLEGGGGMWQRYLAFRDYLRCHPDVRHEYEMLKCALAQRFRTDRPSYTTAKANFIDRIVRLAAGDGRHTSTPLTL